MQDGRFLKGGCVLNFELTGAANVLAQWLPLQPLRVHSFVTTCDMKFIQLLRDFAVSFLLCFLIFNDQNDFDFVVVFSKHV